MSYSPYAPPQAPQYLQGTSRPLGWKTTATGISILATAGLGVVVVGMSSALGQPAPGKLLLGIVLLLLSFALQVLSLAAGILFLVWIYQAATNVRKFGHEGLEYSPGWCVGWWFIPIASFWKPYQAVKEIWRASDPEAIGSASTTAWRSSAVSSTFPLWWTAYNVSGVFAVIGGVGSAIAQLHKEDPGWSHVMLMLGQSFSVMAAVAIVSIVRQLDRRQAAAAQRLASLPAPPGATY